MASAGTNRVYSESHRKRAEVYKQPQQNQPHRPQIPTKYWGVYKAAVYTVYFTGTNLIKGTVRAAYFYYQVLHVALVVVVGWGDSLELTGTTHVTSDAARLLEQSERDVYGVRNNSAASLPQ